MSQNPIQVTVRGKEIVKDPINKLIVQGELEGETIVFTLERYASGKDLLADGVSYTINGLNSNGQSAVNVLAMAKLSDPNKFTLTWNVGAQFTAANYEMRIWIAATKSVNNEVVFQWSSYPARIYIHEGFRLSDYVSVTDQLLLDLGSYLSQAQAAAAAAGNSASQAKTSENNASNSAVAAKSSEVAAAESARKSALSEAGAADSEKKSKASEESATNSEANSKASELAAAESARKAALSDAAAADSQKKANESENAAAKSEANAAGSEAVASQKADDARQSAVEAKDSATEALISEQQSKNAADDSRGSAAAALESERKAKQSEETVFANIDRSESAASRADQSANDAEDAARRAKDSENQAVQSAADAEGSAIDAQYSADNAYQIIQDAIASFGNDVLLSLIIMRDPTTGELDTAQNIINNLFGLNSNALTAFEYQQLGLTAEEYAAYNITAYEYITDGKRILTGSSVGSGGGSGGDASHLEPRIESLEGRASSLESQVGDFTASLLAQSGDIQGNRSAIGRTNRKLDDALLDIQYIKDVLQI